MKRNAECKRKKEELKGGTPGQEARNAERKVKNEEGRARKQKAETDDGRVLVTRPGLAVALGVSLRTVDRMLADGEIEPVRLRGWSVRFHIPDVVQGLTQNLATRKHGRRARVARS